MDHRPKCKTINCETTKKTQEKCFKTLVQTKNFLDKNTKAQTTTTKNRQKGLSKLRSSVQQRNQLNIKAETTKLQGEKSKTKIYNQLDFIKITAFCALIDTI